MTIKELENRTGMTRANIRYYEGEGLLAPKRLDNGYRDYSEADVRTLEKIRLLRQLQLDIDTIRKVQAGTLTLDQALFVQTTRLEGDKAVIERAAAVCRELERSGVEYAALDPQPWLARLEPPEPPELPQPSPEPPRPERDNTPRACYCPWQRLFARSLDMGLYDVLINVAWQALFRDQSLLRLQTETILGRWFCGLALLGLTLLLEPFWLHFWGWTPGKWIFGLKVRDEDGSKLSLAQARRRCAQLAWEGYALNIPIYSQWRMWQCRVTGLEGRDCAWDGECGYRYTKEKRGHYVLAYLAVQGACAAALALAGLWSLLPPCRGELTVAEFARNYDFYFRTLGMDGQYAYEPTLDEEGRWREAAAANGSVVVRTEQGFSVSSDGQSYLLDDEETVWEEPEFTLEDGRVTAVTLRWESNGAYLFSGGIREGLALLAMTGAVDGLNLFNYDLTGWASLGDRVFGQWGDVEVDHRGLHISQKMESSGYEDDGTFLFAQEGELQHCEKTVTISLIE